MCVNGDRDQEAIQPLSSHLQEQQKEGIFTSLAALAVDFRKQSCGFQVLPDPCPALPWQSCSRFLACLCRCSSVLDTGLKQILLDALA